MGLKIVSFKAPEELVELVDKIAIRTGKSRSILLRECMELLVEKYADKIWKRDDILKYKPRIEKIRIK